MNSIPAGDQNFLPFQQILRFSILFDHTGVKSEKKERFVTKLEVHAIFLRFPSVHIKIFLGP